MSRNLEFFCGVWNRKSQQKAISVTVSQVQNGQLMMMLRDRDMWWNENKITRILIILTGLSISYVESPKVRVLYLDTWYTTGCRKWSMYTLPFLTHIHTYIHTIQWLRLALSKGPNWAGVFFPPFHLRMETDPVSEMSCSFKHRTMDKVQKPRNSLCYWPSSQPFRNYR
jgi:hypothetical protein